MVILRCAVCEITIGLNNKSGLCSKHYKEQWKLSNKEREANNNKKYYASKSDYVRAVVRARYYKVRESKEFKAYHAAKEAKHRAVKLNATPKWADLSHIKAIYDGCPDGYHVDHIVPLKHKDVCGLHVPWNLQVIPAIENLKKSNKLT